MRHTLTIRGTVSGDVYYAFLDHCFRNAASVLLIARYQLGLSLNAGGLIGRLERLRGEVSLVRSWPGTALQGGDRALQVAAATSDEVKCIIRPAIDDLFHWLQPELPEDLCFLRTDGSPYLTSVTHEHDAWLELDETEWAALKADVPAIVLSESRD